MNSEEFNFAKLAEEIETDRKKRLSGLLLLLESGTLLVSINEKNIEEQAAELLADIERLKSDIK